MGYYLLPPSVLFLLFFFPLTTSTIRRTRLDRKQWLPRCREFDTCRIEPGMKFRQVNINLGGPCMHTSHPPGLYTLTYYCYKSAHMDMSMRKTHRIMSHRGEGKGGRDVELGESND
ncbi:hypothetical protein GGS20DRAFT_98018 [Poronia punctata]|nr:hypothetical protein GGS20DRAFT_98018 [Poronia punctata]